jgi:hypothetical protein
MDADLLAPFQQLDVLQSADALLHLLQHLRAEALDARLNGQHAGVAQQPHLFLLQVRLRLVEQRDVQLCLRQFRQQRLEVLQVEDVVDDLDVAARIRRRQVFQLGERARRRLAAERHRRAVEAAEGAVHPLAPPAAAGGFDEHARLPRLAEPAGLELREEIGVVWERQRVHVGDRGRGRRRTEGGRPGNRSLGDDAGNAAGWLAANDALCEIGEDLVGFARDDGVDEGELSHCFHAHRRLAIGAAEHNEDVGQPCFQTFGQRQRCQMLLEHAREADDARLQLGDAVGAPIDIGGRGVPGPEQSADFTRRRRTGIVASQP